MPQMFWIAVLKSLAQAVFKIVWTLIRDYRHAGRSSGLLDGGVLRAANTSNSRQVPELLTGAEG